MSQPNRQAKLSTILANDFMDYTARIGINEEGTLKQLAIRREIIQQKC